MKFEKEEAAEVEIEAVSPEDWKALMRLIWARNEGLRNARREECARIDCDVGTGSVPVDRALTIFKVSSLD